MNRLPEYTLLIADLFYKSYPQPFRGTERGAYIKASRINGIEAVGPIIGIRCPSTERLAFITYDMFIT